jgi:mRNA interferase MazF
MLPSAGDIAWVEFDPALGTEQAGRRPALILSGREYHEASARAVVCPITKRARLWPFEVHLPPMLKTRGVVLVDQIRTIDRSQRLFEVIETAPEEVLVEVQNKLAALIGISLTP